MQPDGDVARDAQHRRVQVGGQIADRVELRGQREVGGEAREVGPEVCGLSEGGLGGEGAQVDVVILLQVRPELGEGHGLVDEVLG